VYQLGVQLTLPNGSGGQKQYAPVQHALLVVPDAFTETFEHPGLRDKYSWKNSSGAPWKIASGNAETGTFSARAGGTTKAQSSILSIDVSLPADSVIVFSWRTLTSPFYAGLSFTVDTTVQAFASGYNDWSVERIQVPKGNHTLSWMFSTYGDAPDSNAWVDNVFFPGNVVVTSVGENRTEVPTRFVLEQSYPNPANPTTRISYTIGRVVAPSVSEGRAGTDNASGAGSGLQVAGSRVRLTVYDILGREVAVLVDGVQAPGRHEVVFDARNLASGVYVYRLTAGAFSASRTLTIVK
jgi:hypothetical protein